MDNKKFINGCKTATVFLWIGFGGCVMTASIGLLGSLAIGNAAGIITGLVAVGMSFLYGWMARSVNAAVKHIEGKKKEEEE
jgi:hypothetical protein